MFSTFARLGRVAFLVIVLPAVMMTSACQDASSPSPDSSSTSTASSDEASTPGDAPSSPWPAVEREADPEVERFVEDVLSRMTLERKVGQIIQAEIKHVTPEEVRDYALGSVLNGGGSFPDDDGRAAVSDWVELSRQLHAAALEAGGGDPAIPLLWGTDAVHGHNNVFGATLFPHNIGLGATRDAELVRAIGRATAEQVSATGIDWNFAPTVAVSRDLRWGRAYESFSSNPALVAELGRAAIIGLQGEPGNDWLKPPRVLATAKHFVGDGGTHKGEDQGDARMSEEALADVHGRPYPEAIRAGVQTVMASFSSWNGEKMHGHRYLLTEVLKGRMGFDGLVIGDWNGHAQVPGCSVTDCLTALEAGVDLFMVPEDWRAFHDTLLEHARNGNLPIERLDDAVRRILRVKKRAGLFHRTVQGKDRLPDSEAHAALARRAVRQSLVLLKNDNSALPINPGSKILVVGDGADDIGKQSGGWTLDWQGVKDDNDRFPNAQSIYAGIAEQVRAAGGETRLGESAAEGFEPDAVIAVYGEDPYAEGQGDIETLEFQPGTRDALKQLDRVGQLEVPVVSVFLSGRPLWTNPELNRSDAFVAAWLPGTEASGIADVLLSSPDGAIQHDFSGQLSFAWPAVPGPDDQGAVPPLFDVGFGLDYASHSELRDLDEDAMAPLDDDSMPTTGDWVLFDGAARSPWRLAIGPLAGAAEDDSPNPLEVALTDRHLQGDARRVTWSGEAAGAVALVTDSPIDLRPFYEDNAVLRFDLRPDRPLPEDLFMRIDCGPGCAGEIELAPTLREAVADEWRTVRVDLACLIDDGARMAAVQGLTVLATTQQARISVADIRLERDAADDADLRCTP